MKDEWWWDVKVTNDDSIKFWARSDHPRPSLQNTVVSHSSWVDWNFKHVARSSKWSHLLKECIIWFNLGKHFGYFPRIFRTNCKNSFKLLFFWNANITNCKWFGQLDFITGNTTNFLFLPLFNPLQNELPN